MIFEQIYLDSLAQASYLLGSDGVAALVDPRRDVEDYLDRIEQHGLRLEHVLLTHTHADFVAGHTELARRTGARIAISHRVECGFDRQALREGDVVQVGRIAVRVLETPGHTPGDVCYLVEDGEDPSQPVRLLSGDTLFLGDVGRPDLAGGLGHTAADMAGMMYDTLRAKILPLDDDVEVWPAHGAGSACGRNISDERSSTIGQQRIANHALQPIDRETFVRTMLDGLGAPPAYFAHAAELNRRGPVPLSELPELRPLSETRLIAGGLQLLDTRSAAAYGAGHLPGSINVGLSGRFESWCGSLLDLTRAIAIVADSRATAAEARLRLTRVGLDEVAGYAEAATLTAAREALPQVEVAELHRHHELGEWQLIDVRGPGEYAGGHAPGAVLAPLAALRSDPSALADLDYGAPTAVICESGSRSSTACGLLAEMGFRDLRNVTGGTSAWRAANLPLET